MKKFAIAAVVILSIIVAWGYVTFKRTFMEPVPLVQQTVGPYCVVFGEATSPGGRKDALKNDDLKQLLRKAGVSVLEGTMIWYGAEGTAERAGVMIDCRDVRKAARLDRKYRAVTLPAQKAWMYDAGDLKAGGMGMAMKIPGAVTTIVKKAGELKMNSYCMHMDITTGRCAVELLLAPK